eukprot:1274359-Rhodomonas_salina.1
MTGHSSSLRGSVSVSPSPRMLRIGSHSGSERVAAAAEQVPGDAPPAILTASLSQSGVKRPCLLDGRGGGRLGVAPYPCQY